MAQFMLSIHHEEGEQLPPPEEMQPVFEAVERFNDTVRDAGAWVFAGGLEGIESATTVDATHGDPVVTDGPFAQGKEYLGGFWVIEAADLDEALRWAAGGSAACGAAVEVRPFQAE